LLALALDNSNPKITNAGSVFREKAHVMNILGKRYIFFALSLLIIVSGLITPFAGKVPLSIDFTGGSLLEVSRSLISRQTCRDHRAL
jgi:preprotein translocase subunit SecF